jgi:uncharacterized membrane protein YbhN (UPF0104 family)
MALAQVPVTAAIGVLIACWLATTFQALRFYFLYSGGLSALRHIGLNFALQTGNIQLPMRSGELLRPFYMKRWNGALSLKVLAGWSIVDKVAEVMAIVPLVVAACAVFSDDPRFHVLSRWAWPIAGVLGCIGLLLLFKLRAEFATLVATPTGGARFLTRVSLSLLCSFTGWLLNLAMFYFIVHDLRLALALIVAVNLAVAIPGLPAGLGAFEAAFVWVGRMGGLPREHALALALVVHVLQIIGTLSIGLPILSAWGWPERLEGLS